jgi:hypothetical protein
MMQRMLSKKNVFNLVEAINSLINRTCEYNRSGSCYISLYGTYF